VQKIIWWSTVSALLAVFIFIVKPVLTPFVLSFVFAYFLNPAVTGLEKLKIRRSIATLFILISFLTVIILAISALIPILFAEGTKLLKSLKNIDMINNEILARLLNEADKFQLKDLRNIKKSLGNSSELVLNAAKNSLAIIWHSGVTFISIISFTLITPVVTFYVLRDWKKITTSILGLIPRKQIGIITEHLSKIDHILAAYIRGQVNICLILGSFYATALTIVGLDLAILIGSIIGILAFIPYIGATTGFLISFILALKQFDSWVSIGIIMLIFASGQILESSILTPKLIGKKVDLHPVWVIFSMLAGGAVYGFLGILIAVPTAATIGVIIRSIIQKYRQSPIYSF
jgi:predicted PurR-regulated permease PerM